MPKYGNHHTLLTWFERRTGYLDQIVQRVKQLLKDTNEEKMSSYVNDVAIDYFLWGFRREKADEMIKFPYHKVRSIYY